MKRMMDNNIKLLLDKKSATYLMLFVNISIFTNLGLKGHIFTNLI